MDALDLRQSLCQRNIDERFFDVCDQRFGRFYADSKAYATGLQAKCFSNEAFWAGNNLIIQGPTSAGKTFIGEIAAYEECMQDHSVLFLVPLRSMVREKYEDFLKYYQDTDLIPDIYASSSDYQENDYRITMGKYSIAVMVYEKFLALRADSNNEILKRCRLVVVDEMQMLIDDRGVKLEAALVDMKREMQMKSMNIRIIGLTTTFCNMEKVAAWIDDAVIIQDDERPVAFREHVIAPNGNYKSFHTSSDNSVSPVEYEGTFGCSAKKDTQVPPNYDLQRTELLISLIKKLISEKRDAGERCPKILVYNADKANIEELCGRVKNEYKNKPLHCLEQGAVSLKRKKFKQLFLDSDEDVLFERYIKYGLIFHHSSLSHEYRSYIEDEFRDDNGLLSVVFATDTLTIGINMPIDVVIIFELERPDGSAEKRDLYTYEYKNIVGRAGRFGTTPLRGQDYMGQSFLLVDRESKIKQYYQKYVLAGPVKIDSALRLSGYELIPYALSWASGKMQRSEIDQNELENCVSLLLAAKSKSADIPLLCNEVLLEMVKHNLLFVDATTNKYGILRRSRSLAGLIYFYNTYKRLLDLFDDVCTYIKENDITDENTLLEHLRDIELAILYNVCSSEDILAQGQFSRREKRLYANKQLTLYLLDMLEPKTADNKLHVAPFPSIKIINIDTLVEERFHALARTLMLYIWSEGMPLNDNKYYSFDTISSGSIAKLADLAEYLLDGLVRICETHLDPLISNFLARKLAEFAGCIQYGETLEMVKVRKVLRISRTKLRKLKNDMRPTDPTDFVEYITFSDNERISEYIDKETARSHLISTREIYSLPSVDEDDLTRYLDSYNERARNIQKFRSFYDRQDNLAMFQDLVRFTQDFSLREGKIEEAHVEEDLYGSYSDYLCYPNSLEGRILLDYLRWRMSPEDIELEDYRPFMDYAKKAGMTCIIGPKLPDDCIDLVNSYEFLYIEKDAFLLLCLYDNRLRTQKSRMVSVFEKYKGYLPLANINAISKRAIKGGMNKVLDDFFISYCTEDRDFVEKILNVLRNSGYTFWCDLTEHNNHDNMDAYITEGFRRTRQALIIGTRNYFSNWNGKRYREREFRDIINNAKPARILRPAGTLQETRALDEWVASQVSTGYASIPKIDVDLENLPSIVSHNNFPREVT